MKRIALGLITTLFLGNCTLLTRGTCGDGVIDVALGEECDNNGADCNADCTLNNLAECGNGVEETGEECDDGNANNTDDCLDSCVLASCGDGFIQSGVETCEPPNVGGCDANCQVTCTIAADCLESPDNLCTENEDCNTNLGICTSTAVNIDDNNDCTTDACDPNAGVSHDPEADGTVCDADNNAGTRDICINTNCGLSVCGDNFVDAGNGETCDDGNNINTDACRNNCQLPDCGDNVLDAGETCDDGNIVSGDGCDQNCLVEGSVIDCAQNNQALEDALTANESVINVINGLSCTFTQNPPTLTNKNSIITGQGQAIAFDTLSIDGSSNLKIKNAVFTGETVVLGAAKVIFENSSFTIAVNAAGVNTTLSVIGNAQVGVINSTITNLDTDPGSRGLLCDSVNARFVMDRSTITGNRGDAAIELTNGCRGIIANSLIINNQNLIKDAINVANAAKLNIAFSTFFNNSPSGEQGVVEVKNDTNTECRLDSVVGDDVGAADKPVKSGNAAGVIIATINSFIKDEAEFGITNIDPAINGTFHITNAAVLGQGNPNPGTGNGILFFDPTSIVSGINLFDHDFANNARPQNARDPGAFEEP